MNDYKEQIRAIDAQSNVVIHALEKRVQPLAVAANRILIHAGHNVGRIRRRRREFRSGKLRIVEFGGVWSSRDVEVYYDGNLVFSFDHMLHFLNDMDLKRTLLNVYRPGPWEQAIVDEYRLVSLSRLSTEYGIDFEYCKWFDHDNGVCSKREDQTCPCSDYERVKEAGD